MGIFSRFEQRLAGRVNGAFARAFRAEVQPVELASAMRTAMDEQAVHTGKKERPIVPNLFAVELSGTDYDRLTAHEQPLAAELRASAAEHAETQRYLPGGPFELRFERNNELETGVFRLRPSVADADALRADRPAPRFGQYAPPPADESDDLDPYQDDDYDDYEPYDEGYDEGYDEDDDFEESEDDEDYGRNPRAYQLPGRPAAPRRTSYDPASPSAAAPRAVRTRPWLDLDGETYPLIGASTVIGRDDDADVVLDDPGVSRRHSELRVTNDGPHLVATLLDLGSTNGTYVNGDQVDRHHLQDGDRITIGRTSLTFHTAGGRR